MDLMKSLNEYIKPIIAILTLVFCFSYLLIVLIGGFQVEDAILIALVAILGRPYEYYYGASTGQAKKDEIINELTKKEK